MHVVAERYKPPHRPLRCVGGKADGMWVSLDPRAVHSGEPVLVEFLPALAPVTQILDESIKTATRNLESYRMVTFHCISGARPVQVCFLAPADWDDARALMRQLEKGSSMPREEFAHMAKVFLSDSRNGLECAMLAAMNWVADLGEGP